MANTKRFKVTVNSSDVVADCTDMPVVVELNNLGAGHGFWVAVQSDGDDIRVFKSDGTTEVPVDIVVVDTTAKTGHIFFKATGTLSSSTDTDFWVYYGDSGLSRPAADSTYGSENVWTNYDFVHHMEGSAYTDIVDSTDNDLDIDSEIGSPTYGETGVFSGGECVKYTTSDGSDALKINNFTSPVYGGQDMSFSTWMKLDDTGGNKTIFSFQWDGARGLTLTCLGDDFRIQTRINNILRSPYYAANFSTGTWYHIAGYYDGSNLRYYINGIQRASMVVTGNITEDTGNDTYIGSDHGSSWRMRGWVDHTTLSLSSNTNTAGYLQTIYNSQSDNASFLTLGAEEDVGGGEDAANAIFYGTNF